MTNPFNPDLSKQGSKAGAKDSSAGKPKSTSGVVSEPKAWVFGTPAVDSYASSYHKAYDNESAKLQGVYQSSGSGGGDIHAVIEPESVTQFSTDLQSFQKEITQLTQALNNVIININTQEQWNDSNYHEFASRWRKALQQVEHIDSSIAQQMLPQLERIITAARSAKA